MFVQKEELATTASECSTRLKELAEQLDNERLGHEDKLSELRVRHVRELDSLSLRCDGQRLTDGGTWASVMSSICRSSFVSSLLSSCCHLDTTPTEDV